MPDSDRAIAIYVDADACPVKAEVYAVAERRTAEDYVLLKDVMEATVDEIEASGHRGEGMTGVPTGFYELDELTHGLHPGQMIVIAARPAVGKSTFALPDLQGSSPMHPGQGQGLSLRDLGQIGGSQTVTLLTSEMPAHAHFVGRAKAGDGDSVTPVASVWAQSAFGRGTLALYHEAPANAKVNQLLSLSVTGGGQPHNNMQPYLTLNFCIALQGVFPQRP